ncbi:hypothetical protein ILYODFUR_015119 [Ilyodon furcidens]|uniref:Tumor protein p53-inducible protein 11 n=1 Tax=Ilyodon furcidens TaxID=33524 RepID=A0ABV0T997_9TELE
MRQLQSKEGCDGFRVQLFISAIFRVWLQRSLLYVFKEAGSTQGEIFRNNLKISQMLGNELKFAVREPIGLRVWILISAVGFTVMAVTALVFPNQLYELVFEEELFTTSISVRLYGAALLSLALIMWNGLYTAEKVIIQWTLLSEACYFAVQFLVTCITLMEMGILPNAAMLLLLSRVLFFVVTIAYYYHLGRKPKKI